MKYFNYSILFVLIFMFTGCGFQQVQYTNRTQLITMGHSQEMQLGLSASEQVKKDNSKYLDKDKQLLSRVQKIGNHVATVAKRADFQWEFHTISKDTLNAFCLPGGKVFVYTGILKAAKNDDQLATVISHEIAHAIARHGAERASMGQLVGIGGQVLSAVVNTKAPAYNQAFNVAYGLGANYGLMMPYSRKHELEADYIGLVLMRDAGYDTKEALKFWENMSIASKSNKNSNDFFSTHPNHHKRIEQIEKFNTTGKF